MKKIGQFFRNLLIIAYAIVAIFVTVLLLSYNDYRCSQLGAYTFLLLTNEGLEPDYNPGDLAIVKNTKPEDIEAGDSIFLYRNISSNQYEIKYAKVILVDDELGGANTKYILEGNTIINYRDVIGTSENTKAIPYLGTVLSILESRYGYLFLIVVVSFVAFLYEIYELIMEIKYGEREE